MIEWLFDRSYREKLIGFADFSNRSYTVKSFRWAEMTTLQVCRISFVVDFLGIRILLSITRTHPFQAFLNQVIERDWLTEHIYCNTGQSSRSSLETGIRSFFPMRIFDRLLPSIHRCCLQSTRPDPHWLVDLEIFIWYQFPSMDTVIVVRRVIFMCILCPFLTFENQCETIHGHF